MPTNEQLTHQATQLFAQGKLPEAEKLFVNLSRADPANYQALMMLGLCRRGQGDQDGALARMREAVKVGDNDPETHFYHGRLLMETGQQDAAREALAQALALNPNHAPARTLMGLMALTRDQVDKAIEELHAAVRAGPRYVPALATLAIALLENKQVDKAQEYATRAVEIEPRNSSAQSAMGRVFLARGHHAFAEQCFSNALSEYPENPELNAGMGAALQAAGRDEEALVYFQRAAKANYGGVRLAVDMARSLARTGRMADARKLLEQLHAQLPDSSEVAFYLAEYRMLTNDLEGARELVGGLDSGASGVRLLRARIAWAGREPDAARELLADLLTDDDTLIRRQAGLLAGQVALAQRDFDAGREALAPLLEREAPDIEAALLWVDICQVAGEQSEARRTMESLLEREELPPDHRGRLNAVLAAITDEAGDHARAAAHLAESGWRPAPVLDRLEEQEQSGLIPAWREFDGRLEGPQPDDSLPAPVIVLGWPGSGRELVVAALAAHPAVHLLEATGIDRRRDSLQLPMTPGQAAELDVTRIHLGRKRYLRGFDPAGTATVPLESGWWEISALPALASFFPGTRVVVLYGAGQDLELHWRLAGYRDIQGLKKAFASERALFEHLSGRLPMEFIPVRRGELLADSAGTLEALCGKLDLDFRPEFSERADRLRKSQPYRPDGHWRHYRELLGSGPKPAAGG